MNHNPSVTPPSKVLKHALPSPTSVIDTALNPPTKRQKTPSNLLFSSSDISILDYLRDDALTALIFSFVGPHDTARCARVCRTWYTNSRQHPSLWKSFVQEDFGFTTTTTAATRNRHPWSSVYGYLAERHSTHLAQRQQRPLPAEHSNLEANVVFADDGGNFPGYPAQHALLPSKTMVWCTCTGADQNVDLVVQLKEVSLVTGFIAANGGRGYSAPLKEGLVFCSMDPPDLEAARVYNIEQNHQNSTGSRWVQHLVQPNPTTKNGSAFLLARPAEAPATARPPTPHNNAPIPVAAFSFPDLAQAYNGASEQVLSKPLVARYIHFKLLRSHSPPGLEHISDNIDVMALHPQGVELGLLEDLVEVSSGSSIPEYKRQHPVRRQAHPLLDDGPWNLDDDFGF